jgi:SAM-dependent methyltransferase
LYEKLAAHEFYYPATRWDHQTALTFLKKAGVRSVFEFGCGSGRFLEFARRISNEAVGVDFNPEGVEQARSRGLDVRLDWDWTSRRTFEAVVTFQTLEHLEAPGGVVQQLVDLVAPGGYLIVAVPNEDGPLGKISVNPLNAPPHHATLWPRSALDYIASHWGLSVEQYAKEPLNRTLYFTLVTESYQSVFPGRGLLSRAVRKVLGWKVFADAARAFAEKRVSLDGHNHIAIYRKQAAQAPA